jgi:primosomal protein N'
MHERVLLFYNRREAGFVQSILSRYGLENSSGKVLLATSAIFTANAGRTFDHIVWLFPERDVSYPDFRATEHALYTLARLQQLLVSPRRSIYVVTRREDLVTFPLSVPVHEAVTAIMRERIKWSYPPLAELVRLTVTARTAAAAWKKGSALRDQLEERRGQLAPTEQHAVKIRGPFHSLEADSTPQAVHLIATGPLERLVSLYQGLSVSAADLSPAKIL